MRRLIAHSALAFTALVAVGATFVNVLTKTNSNMEYQSGHEITFKISQKEDVADAKPVEENGEAVTAIIEEMENRLQIAKVTSYELQKVGYDTIKLRLSQEKNEDYSYVSHYLTFDGNLALSFGNDYIEGSEFLTEENATIETYGETPCIVIPINKEGSDYKSLIEKIDTAFKDKNYDYAEEKSSQDENASEEDTHAFYLYLWYDFVEGKCTFEASQDASDPYNGHILMKFLYDSEEEHFYYPGSETKDKLFTAINIDRDGDSTASREEKEFAYKQANYFVNLINASDLEYDVKVYFDEPVIIESSIEPLISYSNDGNHLTVAWSSTFAAALCAILILTFLLIVYYRLGALSISTMSIVSTFVGLLAAVLFNAEFNTFGVIGLILVALASIVSGGIYAHKLKEECDRGRTLKKANAEASKKALLPIVDVNVVVIVLGIFLYIFGGAMLRNFAVITVFGGLVSLLLNTLGLRGMYWLTTNATVLQGKYEAFGVNSELVPNIINEEKQSYFGPYADKNFTSKKTTVGIVSGVLLLASIIGLSVFGGLQASGKSTLYAKANSELPISLYFETNNESSELAESDTIKELLKQIVIYSEDPSKDGKQLLGNYIYPTGKTTNAEGKEINEYNFKLYTRADTEDDLEVTYYIYIINLDTVIPEGAKVDYITNIDTADGSETKPYTYAGFSNVEENSFMTNFNEMLAELKKTKDESDKSTVVAKENAIYSKSEPEFGPVALGTLVAVAALSIYFMLRYRLSRGLTSLIVTLGVTTVSVGLASLLRFLAIPTYIVAAAPFVAAFVMIMSVVFMNREREMIIEDKTHDSSVANRKEIMIKATASAFGASLPMMVLALYLAINFFGFGPVATSWIYIMIIIGIILGGFAVTVLYGPIAQLFYSLFSKVGSNKPKKAKKAKVVRVNKSAEPEEAVFIGIND